MEHVVFYQSAQGTPAFRRVASIDDAVSFAEHLRNVESVTDFSVYALSPVTLSLRAYYHVEVAGADDSQQAPATPAPVAAPAAEEQTAPAELPPPLPTPPEAPSAAMDSAAVESAARESAVAESAAVDPNVVDPTVEEVVPSGRRSMGFFARP